MQKHRLSEQLNGEDQERRERVGVRRGYQESRCTAHGDQGLLEELGESLVAGAAARAAGAPAGPRRTSTSEDRPSWSCRWARRGCGLRGGEDGAEGGAAADRRGASAADSGTSSGARAAEARPGACSSGEVLRTGSGSLVSLDRPASRPASRSSPSQLATNASGQVAGEAGVAAAKGTDADADAHGKVSTDPYEMSAVRAKLSNMQDDFSHLPVAPARVRMAGISRTVQGREVQEQLRPSADAWPIRRSHLDGAGVSRHRLD